MNGFYEFVNNPGIGLFIGVAVVEVLGLLVVVYWGDFVDWVGLVRGRVRGWLKGVALGLLLDLRIARRWIRVCVVWDDYRYMPSYRAALLKEDRLMFRYGMLRFWVLRRRVTSREERKAAIRKRRVGELRAEILNDPEQMEEIRRGLIKDIWRVCGVDKEKFGEGMKKTGRDMGDFMGGKLN